MKTAKQMFEDLGFEFYESENHLICYANQQYYDRFEVVVNTNHKTVEVNAWEVVGAEVKPVLTLRLSPNLILAITKQMKELGWIE